MNEKVEVLCGLVLYLVADKIFCSGDLLEWFFFSFSNDSTLMYWSDTVISCVFQGVTPLYALLQAHQKGIYRSNQVNLKMKK